MRFLKGNGMQSIKRIIKYLTPVPLKKALKYSYYSALDLKDLATGKRNPNVPPRRLNFVGSEDFLNVANEFFGYFTRPDLGAVNYLGAQSVIEALRGAAKDPSLLMTIEEWKRSTNRFPARTYRKVTSTVEPSGIKILRSRTEDDDSADDTADAAEEAAASASADSDDPLENVKL